MTEAVRIRERLLKKGIGVKVIQTPLSMRQGGCGYSLVINPEALSETERTAAEIGCRILSVVRRER